MLREYGAAATLRRAINSQSVAQLCHRAVKRRRAQQAERQDCSVVRRFECVEQQLRSVPIHYRCCGHAALHATIARAMPCNRTSIRAAFAARAMARQRMASDRIGSQVFHERDFSAVTLEVLIHGSCRRMALAAAELSVDSEWLIAVKSDWIDSV